jgi:hypothetical protein
MRESRAGRADGSSYSTCMVVESLRVPVHCTVLYPCIWLTLQLITPR